MNIQLANRDLCTGCSACVSVCPTQSIGMQEDKEGFLQPLIDASTCIGCHKCEKTCPIVSPTIIPADFVTQAYVAINNNEDIRMRSSSGGMFHALAKWTIEQGGVVFGARFDEQWEVVHDYTETIEGIESFMRSKYVQSRIGNTFKQAKQFLDAGRQVLFVGTPCQIGGLKSYLKKEYNNLLAVDFICHGVPSPKVWREYLKWQRKNDTVLDINFRDKKNGWLNFQQVIITTTTTTREDQMENVYFRGFLNNVYLRSSCYNCQFKTISRISDITLADAWGVQNFSPDMHDNKGTSLLFIHSHRGNTLFNKVIPDMRVISKNIGDVVRYNISMTDSVTRPRRRINFFCAFRLRNSFSHASKYIDKDCLYIRLLRKIGKILNLKK